MPPCHQAYQICFVPVDVVSHHFGHDDMVALDVSHVVPQTLGGRVVVHDDAQR
jgi:hypothetical protein